MQKSPLVRALATALLFATIATGTASLRAQNLPNLTPASPSASSAAAAAAASSGASGAITLPPGVSIPPGVQIPKGVNVQQSNAPRSNAVAAPNQRVQDDALAPNPKTANNQAKRDRDSSPDENLEPPKPNAFQTFLQQITGKSVPIYGEELFNRSNPFAALESVPVPSNYVLGPGDEITVKIYSPAIDIDQSFIIASDGTISLPKIGPVPIAGTKVSDV